jgi:predicted TIM-barrel fold metal-dependent hydrolase
MLIDFHTHCFPDGIAQRAINRLQFVAGGLQYHTDGTAKGLQNQMEKNQVDFSVVLNIATNAHQQQSVNDFAASLNRDNLISFGSVFPHSDDVLEELERIKTLGLKGVKLHPDYQRFSVDDEKMKPIYQKISSLGLITVFHAGFDYGYPPPYGATPEKMKKALSWFSSPVVAAHFGGLNYYEQVLDTLCGCDVYFDTAFSYGCMPKYFAEKIIEKHGTDKILFGTDTPWHTPEMELRLLTSLGLSVEELEKIKWKNAKKLLKME